MKQIGSHWMDFHEIWYLSIFRKRVQKIKVSLESDKNKGYFTWRPTYEYTFDHISRSSYNEKCFRKKIVDKIKTHVSGSITFSPGNPAFWYKVEKYCRAGQATDGNMVHAHACWIPNATNTQSEMWYSLLFHCNNGCTNVPQYYVIRTLLVLL